MCVIIGMRVILYVARNENNYAITGVLVFGVAIIKQG